MPTTRRLVAYCLFTIASLGFIGLAAAFFSGNPRAFGAYIFVIFFIAAAGWLIGDF